MEGPPKFITKSWENYKICENGVCEAKSEYIGNMEIYTAKRKKLEENCILFYNKYKGMLHLRVS
jgi:hypothetical protein